MQEARLQSWLGRKGRFYFLFHGEMNTKTGAPAGLGFNGNAAAVEFDEVLGDREAEAGAS